MSEEFDYSTLFFIDCKITCWDHEPPKDQFAEIVRIDLAVVDTTKGYVEESEIIHISPKHSTVTDYCSRLYGVDKAKVNASNIGFLDAYRKLRIHYNLLDRFWASWGAHEKKILNNDCHLHKVEPILTKQSLNVEHLFSLLEGSDKNSRIDNALHSLDIKRTNNIALDAANIYCKITNRYKTKSTGFFSKNLGHLNAN